LQILQIAADRRPGSRVSTRLRIGAYDEPTIAKHLDTLHKAGLITANVFRHESLGPLHGNVVGITQQGLDFLKQSNVPESANGAREQTHPTLQRTAKVIDALRRMDWVTSKIVWLVAVGVPFAVGVIRQMQWWGSTALNCCCRHNSPRFSCTVTVAHRAR
jgi:hypothetical protein